MATGSSSFSASEQQTATIKQSIWMEALSNCGAVTAKKGTETYDRVMEEYKRIYPFRFISSLKKVDLIQYAWAMLVYVRAGLSAIAKEDPMYEELKKEWAIIKEKGFLSIEKEFLSKIAKGAAAAIPSAAAAALAPPDAAPAPAPAAPAAGTPQLMSYAGEEVRFRGRPPPLKRVPSTAPIREEVQVVDTEPEDEEGEAEFYEPRSKQGGRGRSARR